MAGKLYFDSGGTFTKDRVMTLAYGRAYGGSTVVYTGTSLTMPEEVVERWNVPGLEFEDLHRRSLKYIEENNVHRLSDGRAQRQQPSLSQGLPRARLPRRAVPDQRQGLQVVEPVQPWLPQPGQTGHPPGAAAAGRSCREWRSLPTAGSPGFLTVFAKRWLWILDTASHRNGSPASTGSKPRWWSCAPAARSTHRPSFCAPISATGCPPSDV